MTELRDGARLREARLEDFGAVAALKERIGWGRDSAATWSWLWARNPALARDVRRPPIGWIVERDGVVLGYFGNIPQTYRLGGRDLLVGAAVGLCVDPACRGGGYGMALVRAWCLQDAVDMAISTTTSPQVRAMMLAAGALDLPQPDYTRALHWILDRRAFAAAALRKVGTAPAVAAFAAPLAAAALVLNRSARAVAPPPAGRVTVEREPRFGDEHDAFWERIAGSSSRLLAVRSAEALQWHYAGPTLAGKVRVLSYRRDGLLTGYAVTMRMDAPEVGLHRWRVVDLLAERDDPEVVRALVGAACETARGDGACVLETLGFPAAVRATLDATRPGSRLLGENPFLWSPRSPGVAEALASPSAWYAGPYDGDSALLFLD